MTESSARHNSAALSAAAAPAAAAPSDSIQISLHRRTASLSQYQTTCISKHYALNNQILAAFESHYRNGLYQVAYYLGLKFVETALLEIPKHGYFYSDKHAPLRLESSIDALRVTHLLQGIIAKEPEAFAKECHRIERLHHLGMEQYDNLGSYEGERKTIEQELCKSYPKEQEPEQTLTSTLLACGDSFTSVFCPAGASSMIIAAPASKSVPFPPAAQETKMDQSFLFPPEQRQPSAREDHLYPPIPSRLSLIDSEDDDDDDDDDHDDNHYDNHFDNMEDQRYQEETKFAPLPSKHQDRDRDRDRDPTTIPTTPVAMGVPVVLEPPAHNRTQSDCDLQRALFLSGLHVGLPTTHGSMEQQQQQHRLAPHQESLLSIPETAMNGKSNSNSNSNNYYQNDGNVPFAPPGAKKRDSDFGLSMKMLTDCYHEDFDALRDAGRVSISQVPTYQGRVPHSTNGCTIIAPLLCIHHFHNEHEIPDPGLHDQIIVEVIDEETPTILPIVRKSMGLVQDAFLIPVDAHESLMEQHYMCQEQFLTVCGGSILEEKHLEPLLEQLSIAGPKKLAATFFFHEHVITILQLQRSEKTIWFDIIDSLPHEATLSRSGGGGSFSGGGETTTTSVSSSMRSSEDLNQQNPRQQHRQQQQQPLRLESEKSWTDGVFVVDHIPPLQAARIRCLDIESLKATLLWYACSVFTDENRAYIDTYHWDEKLSDFDPRVFQAFIWIEA